MRENPAVRTVHQLAYEDVGEILVVEPHINELPLELTGLEEGLKKADILVVLVDHQAFRGIPQEAYAGKARIDTRGMWE